MKIKNLVLRNFRCFPTLDVTFHDQLTVMVAVNGGGKTTILDAVARVLSPFLRAFDKDCWIRGNDDDVRLVKKDDVRTLVFPSTIEAAIQLPDAGGPVTWGRTLIGTPERSPDYAPAKNYGERLLQIVQSDLPSENVVLPVIAYYRAQRVGATKKLPTGPDLGDAALMRPQGYAGCLWGSANTSIFSQWYRKAAWAELSVQSKLAANEPVAQSNVKLAARARAVKESVNEVLKGVADDQRYWLDMFISLGEVGLLDTLQRVELSLNQLSDGVGSMLSLAGDLAARCVVLNPHFGADAPAMTPGVVLIDEIDLHLHPSWQQRILADLTRVFRGMQFVVTTHSPQVLTSVDKQNIRTIERKGEQYTAPEPSWTPLARESGDALASIMKVHVRPDLPILQTFRSYEQLVKSGQGASSLGRSLREKLEGAWGSNAEELKMLDIVARHLARRAEGGDP